MTWLAAIAAASVVLYYLLGLLRLQTIGLPLQMVNTCICTAAAMATRWWLYDRHVRRLVHKAITHDLSLCLHCAYSLKGLPERHKCPECGLRYDIAETQHRWEQWLIARSKLDVYGFDGESQALRKKFRLMTRNHGTCMRCGKRRADKDAVVCPHCGAVDHDLMFDL